MRVGKNPYKGEAGKGKAYLPKEVTVSMLTFIPNFNGYYKERFEVLKVSLTSLIQNTEEEHDLLVFDNGSCKEVKDYLLNLHELGHIAYLFLSNENLGYNGALNFIFSASPGKYIAYSDDDVFFHRGWLKASMDVYQAFPQVGYVTGCPVKSQYKKHAESTINLPSLYNDINVLPSIWEEKWDNNHASSLGANVEEWKLKFKENIIPVYNRNNILALPVSSHFQYLISKEATKVFLPFKVGNIMSSDINDPAFNMMLALDKKLDDAGYAKLTTAGLFTEHLGNVISDRCKNLIKEYTLEVNISSLKSKHFYSIEKPGIIGWVGLKLLNTPGIRKIPSVLYDTSFKIMNWKQAQDKRKVLEKLNKSKG